MWNGLFLCFCLVFFFFPLIDLKVAQLTFIQSQVYLCDIIGSDSHLCFCFVVPGIRPRTLYAPAVVCQGDSSLALLFITLNIPTLLFDI